MCPSISILIPAKGNLNYFSYTLESIYKSSYSNYDVLLVDDGISQQALKQIENMTSGFSNFRIIKNQGVGIVDAINTGIAESTGEYIARIDADDCLLPERLQAQLSFLVENQNVGVVGSRVTYINEFGNSTGKSKHPLGHLTLTGKAFRSCPIAHPSVMMRREILNKVDNYQSFLKHGGREYAEDYFLWTRIAKVAEIWNVETPLTLYRQHANQVSASNFPVTALAAELVYLKIYDSENAISIPLDLDSISNKMIRQFLILGIRKIGLLYGIHLYSRFLLTRSLPSLTRHILNLFSRIIAIKLRVTD